MRILVTNDDGVHAPGIGALASAAVATGHEVVVCGPLEERSGYGTSIGPLHPTGRIVYERLSLRGLDGVDVVGVDGAPAMAVLAAALGGFGAKPDLVLSGVNPGLNAGRAVLHSGTVGAALTAVAHGIPAVAVSVDLPRAGGGPSWSPAADLAVTLGLWAADQPRPVVCNLNVPDGSVSEVRAATLATEGVVQAVMEDAGENVLTLRYGNAVDVDPDSDLGVLAAGAASVTVLLGLRASGDHAASVDAAGHVGDAVTRVA